jgi:nicotinate-nucleotide adenylyltransferase
VRIGILGGTFDPIHVGHLAAARVAMECARLDRVVFVPSAVPPHREPAVAGPRQRLEMTRRAIEGDPRFQASDVEISRGGKSFTSDTIAELHGIHPKDDLFLILGWDAARLFHTWHMPTEIERLASVVVVSRPGVEDPNAAELQAAGLDPARTVVCRGRTPDISGSELRDAIGRAEPVSEWLPEPVRSYIAEQRLYGDNHQVGC